MPQYQMPQRAKIYGYLAAWGVLLPLLFSCAQQTTQLSPTPMDGPQVVQDYLIGPEDIVEVMVWKNPDLSRVVQVRPDGKISLPLIGDIQAAELTVVQLKDRLTERLKDYYKEPPQVSVIVQEINSYAIYVLGEVRSPGRYVVKTGTTFLQVLTLAGGFTDFAATKRIMVRRRGVGGSEETAMSFRYKDIIGGTQSNILMKPGDTVIIP